MREVYALTLSDTMDRNWNLLDRTLAFDGYFKIIRYRLQHTLFAGGWGKPIVREVFERGSAAAVLPYDRERDELLLVEQFRIGALNDPAGPWLMELIAGIIEPGEPIEEVVRREAVEEAGITLDEVTPITDYYVSPGGTTEKLHLFWATADLSGAGGVHGLEDEGEDIRVHVVRPEEAFRMVDEGEIRNAMTLLALQWFRARYAEWKS